MPSRLGPAIVGSAAVLETIDCQELGLGGKPSSGHRHSHTERSRGMKTFAMAPAPDETGSVAMIRVTAMRTVEVAASATGRIVNPR